MVNMKLDRRQFLSAAALAGTLACAGGLPLLRARAGGNGSGIDANTGPGEVKPIRGYLRDHAPVAGEGPARGPYRLTYDVVHWDWTPANTDNTVVGTLDIAHDGQGGFTVAQDIAYGATRNLLDAEIACGPGPLRPLTSWTLTARAEDMDGNAIARLGLRETGKAEGDAIRVAGPRHEYSFRAGGAPVVSQWTMLEYFMREAGQDTDIHFDLLQDLSLHKADQRLVYTGPVEVPMAGGTIKLESYRQTGPAVLPTHYLVDDEGLPQLVTTMIMAWGLRTIS